MSVPFFKDFSKKTKGFFKQSRGDDYNLGESLNFKLKNNDFTFKGKLKQSGNNLDQKLVLILSRKFGNIEIEENGSKISATINVPNIYKDIDLETKHTNKEVNVTVKYKPKNCYYNARFKGDYAPNKTQKGNISFAVGDDSLNLSVGGEVTINKSVSKSGNQTTESWPYNYKLGFLYQPNKESQYSVEFAPDQTGGLDYSFDLYRKLNATVDIAGRATGKVDTSIDDGKPTISIGAGFNLKGGNRLQGFVNSQSEYGFYYKAKVTPSACITFGVSGYKAGNNDVINPRLGYKFEI
mmetsp:Transcript_57055/g.69684  ORF Transcript_57055/g.69684 Transcript_57055/m.69684 type:complete len:295 (+) Transcript_57055:35-919(+)